MFDFEKSPIWQKEAILIAEMLCAFYGVTPVQHYNDPLNKKIERLRLSIGQKSALAEDISTLEEILKLVPKLKSKAIESKKQFLNECRMVLKSNREFLKADNQPGLPSIKGNFEYWFLALIEETRNDARLDEEFLAFVRNKGIFRKWYEVRYGNKQMPFSFPDVKLGKIQPKRKSDYKYQIKKDIYRSLNSAYKRRTSLSDPAKVKKSTAEIVTAYRKILFNRNEADEVELGFFSYWHQLENL